MTARRAVSCLRQVTKPVRDKRVFRPLFHKGRWHLPARLAPHPINAQLIHLVLNLCGVSSDPPVSPYILSLRRERRVEDNARGHMCALRVRLRRSFPPKAAPSSAHSLWYHTGISFQSVLFSSFHCLVTDVKMVKSPAV